MSDARPRVALEKFRAELAKSYGERVALPLDDDQAPPPYQVVSTGSLTLDRALGIGGLAMGRIHELVGPPDSSKTTVVINTAASLQRMFPDLAVGYVDMEGTFDNGWARRNGLSLGDQWDHVYPDHSEDASDLARRFCRSGVHSGVIVDSIGGMESLKALAKDAQDELPGRNAQVITRMVKHLATLARQNNVLVILVNQLRASIGQFGGDQSAGPKAMQHATTTRIVMRRMGGEEDVVSLRIGGDLVPVSFRFRARVARSKIVPVGGVAEFWVSNRDTEELGPAGINRADEIVTVGVSSGVITMGGGGYYTVPGLDKPVRGKVAFTAAIREDDALAARLRDMILEGSDR